MVFTRKVIIAVLLAITFTLGFGVVHSSAEVRSTAPNAWACQPTQDGEGCGNERETYDALDALERKGLGNYLGYSLMAGLLLTVGLGSWATIKENEKKQHRKKNLDDNSAV